MREMLGNTLQMNKEEEDEDHQQPWRELMLIQTKIRKQAYRHNNSETPPQAPRLRNNLLKSRIFIVMSWANALSCELCDHRDIDLFKNPDWIAKIKVAARQLLFVSLFGWFNLKINLWDFLSWLKENVRCKLFHLT